MGDRLTKAEVVERQGVSRQRVEELVKEGRLLVGDDGKFDSDDVDACWSNMDPAYLARKAAAEANAKAEKPKEGSQADTYHKARTAEAVTKAQARQLDYQIKAGKYVKRDEVKRGAFKAGKLLAAKLNNAPNQLAPQLVGLKDARAAHEILQNFMAQLARDISDELASLG